MEGRFFLQKNMIFFWIKKKELCNHSDGISKNTETLLEPPSSPLLVTIILKKINCPLLKKIQILFENNIHDEIEFREYFFQKKYNTNNKFLTEICDVCMYLLPTCVNPTHGSRGPTLFCNLDLLRKPFIWSTFDLRGGQVLLLLACKLKSDQ